ncbi:MAG: TIGR02584 family CRISPR-associated protein [Candidatus Competibacteraceae bacterium]|nr:TIGR02584 family CRISPR-associated protein [Candidatus Competibacteraceae bacterium]
MNPESYPRRILLCVAGLSPQIVTETLYALTVTGEPRFVPTEIHILTTAEGAERARLTLLGDEPGWFQRLRQDYGLPEIRFDLDTIHLLRAADGRLLDDASSTQPRRSQADARCRRLPGVLRRNRGQADADQLCLARLVRPPGARGVAAAALEASWFHGG